MKNYKPFVLTVMQETEEFGKDETFEKYSDDGKLWVVVGNIAIGIKQYDNRVVIDCTDHPDYLQDVGKMEIYFDDIEKIEDDEKV